MKLTGRTGAGTSHPAWPCEKVRLARAVGTVVNRNKMANFDLDITAARFMATDSVGQLRAIADQPVAHPDQHQARLLLSRLHRHEAHRWPAHRLAKRFGVGRIVLAALDIRLDQLGAINFTVCPNDCNSRAQ